MDGVGLRAQFIEVFVAPSHEADQATFERAQLKIDEPDLTLVRELARWLMRTMSTLPLRKGRVSPDAGLAMAIARASVSLRPATLELIHDRLVEELFNARFAPGESEEATRANIRGFLSTMAAYPEIRAEVPAPIQVDEEQAS